MINKYIEDIEMTLSKLINKRSSSLHSLYEGAEYSLLSSGKRLRPLLVLAATKLCGGDEKKALIPACALELIHTYSLIHDDLPCMDDDDFRRGRPTLHRVYTEGHAVLVGDYLLTFAFEVLAKAPYLSAEQKVLLITTLAEQAGGEGMIGGQVIDVQKEQLSVDRDELNLRKTGALFIAAMHFGGIIAQADENTIHQLEHFGKEFGLFFQTLDDLMDGDIPEDAEITFKRAEDSYISTLHCLSTFSGETSLLKTIVEKLWEKAVVCK